MRAVDASVTLRGLRITDDFGRAGIIAWNDLVLVGKSSYKQRHAQTSLPIGSETSPTYRVRKNAVSTAARLLIRGWTQRVDPDVPLVELDATRLRLPDWKSLLVAPAIIGCVFGLLALIAYLAPPRNPTDAKPSGTFCIIYTLSMPTVVFAAGAVSRIITRRRLQSPHYVSHARLFPGAVWVRRKSGEEEWWSWDDYRSLFAIKDALFANLEFEQQSRPRLIIFPKDQLGAVGVGLRVIKQFQPQLRERMKPKPLNTRLLNTITAVLIALFEISLYAIQKAYSVTLPINGAPTLALVIFRFLIWLMGHDTALRSSASFRRKTRGFQKRIGRLLRRFTPWKLAF